MREIEIPGLVLPTLVPCNAADPDLDVHLAVSVKKECYNRNFFSFSKTLKILNCISSSRVIGPPLSPGQKLVKSSFSFCLILVDPKHIVRFLWNISLPMASKQSYMHKKIPRNMIFFKKNPYFPKRVARKDLSLLFCNVFQFDPKRRRAFTV